MSGRGKKAATDPWRTLRKLIQAYAEAAVAESVASLSWKGDPSDDMETLELQYKLAWTRLDAQIERMERDK